MASRWVKAAFLAVTGLVIAIYAERLVSDLEEALFEALDVQFAGTWELVWLLLWILVAWLFVLAIITVVLSFKEDAHTISDVMARLDLIEDKLTSMQDGTVENVPPGEYQAPPSTYDDGQTREPFFQEEVPPPPRE
jgi:H+/Cl- antiporter ClcA